MAEDSLKKTALLLVLLLFFVLVCAGSNPAKPSFNLFSDANCTHIVTLIDFGNLHVNQSWCGIYFLKNTGNVPLHDFLLKSDCVTLIVSWNMSSKQLRAGEVVAVKFTLFVPCNCSFGQFKLDFIVCCEA